MAVKNVVETPNGWALNTRPSHLCRIKNAQSIRMLSVPDEVLRMNFVPLRQVIRDLGYHNFDVIDLEERYRGLELTINHTALCNNSSPTSITPALNGA
ncbi:MAG: hypothetical protein M0R28_24100 [Pigmentiphaga sp.]|nr:hypothetical protein [Pigmentiphaga sp.]HRP79592.1 hypothetical protein [Aquamicrobium sp.]